MLSRTIIKYCCINNNIQTLNLITKRYAGHSKWANIRHTKALKDAQKSLLFTTLGRKMKAAIHESGTADPAANFKLEQLIAQAKRACMPAGTIQSIIKSTQGEKSLCKSYLLEIKGPGGCIILCEVFTQHLMQTRQYIASITKRYGSKYTDGGGAHLFDRKGIIITEMPILKSGNSGETSSEIATNHAIEVEAEDVKLIDDDKMLQFICEPNNLRNVKNNLVILNYKIINATIEYIPNILVTLSDPDLEMCSNLFEKLEEVNEVVQIYDNIA